MISEPAAIRFRGEVLGIAENVVKMGCIMMIIARFVREARVAIALSGGR
jgi:hypothetical protein